MENISKQKHRQQYPVPSGIYKVCTKRGPSFLGYDVANLHISVGNPNFEEEKFYALCEWASHRFEHVRLIVSDTLQRFNFAHQFGLFSDLAWGHSLKEGDEWLVRNEASINLIENKEIVRWASLIQDPDYFKLRTHMQRLYNKNEIFKEEVNAVVERFLVRKNKVDLLSEHSTFLFLMEELAVFSLEIIYKDAINVYPGTTLMDVAEEMHNLDPTIPIADHLEVDFARNKAHPAWETGSRKRT